MSTKFKYWYLKAKPFPKFDHKAATPKEYLDQWFSEKAAKPNSHPLGEDLVGTAELLEAGLAAGYGKESTWARTLLMSKHERADLYAYLRRRLQATYECLDVTANGIALKSFWRGIEPSEKASLSFAIGSVGALVAARRWVRQYDAKRTIRRFLHARLFVDAKIAKHPMGKPTGDSMPDFFAEDSAGDWHVFEAKGGDQGNRWRQLAQGLQQAKRIRRVGLLGAMKVPRSAVCSQALVSKDSHVELTLLDPPGDEVSDGQRPDDVEVTFIPELLELSVIIDAIDWFAGLRDLDLEEDLAVVAKLREGAATARSRAFGGLILGLPGEYLREEGAIRQAARTLTTLARLVENLEGFDPVFPGPRGPQRLADAARAHMRIQASAQDYDSDALRQIADVASGIQAPGGEPWLTHVVRELRVENRGILELVDKLKAVHQDAQTNFSKLKKADDPLWQSGVMSVGGLALWMENSSAESR